MDAAGGPVSDAFGQQPDRRLTLPQQVGHQAIHQLAAFPRGFQGPGLDLLRHRVVTLDRGTETLVAMRPNFDDAAYAQRLNVRIVPSLRAA